MIETNLSANDNMSENWCPFDRWLRFHDIKLEDEFWKSRMNFLCRLDFIYLANSIFQLFAVFSRLWMENVIGPAVHYLDFFLFIAFYTWILVHCYKGSPSYIANRIFYQALLNWSLCVGASRYLGMMGPPANTLTGFWLHVLTKTTCAGLFWSILIAQVPFRYHLVIHTVGLTIALSWASKQYCTVWFNTDVFRAMISSICNAIDHGILHASFFGTIAAPDENGVGIKNNGCELLTPFLYLFIGFVAPTGILYCIELRSKLMFLSNKQPYTRAAHARIWNGTVLMVCWSLLIVGMASWAVLKVLLNALYNDGKNSGFAQ